MSEKKVIYGACRFCGQTRACDEDDLLSAVANGISTDDAPDYVASRRCDCEGAKAQVRHEMKLQAAGAWAENIFENDPEKLKPVLCAIKAVSEHCFGRITIKSGKYLYTIDTDSNDDIRVKTKYTDTQEEVF